MQARTVGADEQSHHNRTAGETKSHGIGHARNEERNASQQQAQHDANENRDHVRLFEASHHVAQLFRHALQTLCFSDDGDAVTHAKQKTGRCHELDAAALHSADVHAVAGAELQASQFFAVDFGACDENALGDEFRIEGVPIDVLSVPVLVVATPEIECQLLQLLLLRDDQDSVSVFKYGLGVGQHDFAVAPESRDHETLFVHSAEFAERVAEHGRVADLKGGDERLVGIFFLTRFLMTREPALHEQKRDDDAQHAQRIGHGATERSIGGGLSQLLERLLGGTESRCVGRGTAKHAQHVLQRKIASPAHGEREQRADHDDTHSQQVELCPALAEGTHEAGTDLKTQRIDKKNQTKTFGIVQHLRLHLNPQCAGKDAHEENVGHAQADAAHFELTQSEPEGADE